MSKKFWFAAAFVGVITLTGCVGGGSDEPMTEAQQAAELGISAEEYQENKEAAARMNMTMDEHMNMGN